MRLAQVALCLALQAASGRIHQPLTDFGVAEHYEGVVEQDFDTSPKAAVEDFDAIDERVVLSPIPSCLSNVVLVIYVEYLPLLEMLDFYKDMYAPYFADVDFYVDGTWCDPYHSGNNAVPCRGETLPRSSVPDEVHLIDYIGGGWLMQKGLMHAIERREGNTTVEGYFFATDDMILNIGLLSRVAASTKCEKILRSRPQYWGELRDGAPMQRNRFWKTYASKAQRFLEVVSVNFRKRLRGNLGSDAKLIVGNQNDFVFLPTWVLPEWMPVAQQMTNLELGFQYTFTAALFGVASMEDMLVMDTTRLRTLRPKDALRSSELKVDGNRTCWKKPPANSTAQVHNFEAWSHFALKQQIFHPVKVSGEINRQFALTVNRPEWSAAAAEGRWVEPSRAVHFWC